VNFVLDDDAKMSFIHIREELIQAPILHTPNWSLQFQIMCYDSNFVVAAVLGQRLDKKPMTIYHARKTLYKAQVYYSTTKQELLAILSL